MACESCGDKPKKCNKDFPKAVIEIDNPEQITLMRKVTIPASMGDDTTVPPAVGKYHNVLLYYEANQKSYLYSSDGIPTQLTNGITDYEAATNLPQINSHTLIGDKTGDQLGLQDKLTAGDNITIENNVISATDTTYGPATDTEIGLVKPGDGLEVDANGTMDISDIEQYAHFFDTVADMEAATNLKAGDYVRTLGYYAIEDGGDAYYYITDTQPSTHYEEMGDSLYAKLIVLDSIKPEMLGAKGDGSVDDSTYLQYCLINYDSIELTKTYLVSNTIEATNDKHIFGGGTLVLGASDTNLLYVSGDNCLVENLHFTNPDNYTSTDISVMPLGRAIWALGNNNIIQNCTIDNYIAGIVFGNNNAGKKKCKALGNTITNLKGLSTGWVNDGIMSFSTDCIIKNNYVDVKTGDDYARAGICCDIHADGCIVDNNIVVGNDNVIADIHVEQSLYCVVSNNQCYSPRSQGMCVGSYTRVLGNYVETGNKIVAGYTINISGLLCTSVNNVLLSNNMIVGRHSSSYGVFMSTGNNNVVTSNKFVGEENNMQRGINCLSTNRSIFEGNTFLDSLINTIGITVSSGDANIICNNVIGLCYGTSTSGRGIALFSCTNYKVDKNSIDNYYKGIFADNSCTNGCVTYNSVICTADAPNINTGIDIGSTATTNTIYITNNYVQTASWRKINKATNGDSMFVSDNGQLELLDTSLSTVKKITVTNSSLVVS